MLRPFADTILRSPGGSSSVLHTKCGAVAPMVFRCSDWWAERSRSAGTPGGGVTPATAVVPLRPLRPLRPSCQPVGLSGILAHDAAAQLHGQEGQRLLRVLPIPVGV